MEEPRVLAPALIAALDRCRRRRRWVAIACGSGAAVVTLGGAGPLLIALDAGARVTDGWRWLAWSLVVTLAAAVFWRQVRGSLQCGNDVAVAQDLERRAGISSALLSSGISLLRAPPRTASAWMTGRTIALADLAAARLHNWSTLVPLPRTWPALGGGVLLVVALSSTVSVARPWLQRAYWPGAVVGRPGSLQVEALPGTGTLPTGDELTVTAVLRDVHGEPSSNARKVTAFISWHDGREEQRQLEPSLTSPSLWHLTLPPVTCALTWRIRADRDGDGRWDGESERRTLTLIEGFKPSEVVLRLTPPAYSTWPAHTVSSGDATCLGGTTITAEVTITAGGPRLVAATIVLEADDGSPQRELPANIHERTLSATWTARSTQRWGLRLIAAGGHEELPNRRWRIAVTTDQPPAVHVDDVPNSLAADASEVVVLLAEDDVGIRDATLEIRRNHRLGELLTQIQNTPLVTPNGTRQQRWAITIDAAALGLQLGDSLAVVPVATDHAGQVTRGEAAGMIITSDGSAGWGRLASNLRARLSAVERAAAMLPSLINDAERVGSDALARQVADARRRAWSTALSGAAKLWPARAELTAAAAFADRDSRTAVGEITWWAQQWLPADTAEQPDAADPARSALPLRAASAELNYLRNDLLMRERYASAQANVAQTTAAAMTVNRQARGLRADVWWQNRPVQGLSAVFSADADTAVTSQPTIELPDFLNRDLPGYRTTNFRIHYSGLLHVPDDGGELVVGADDGVRLSIAGSSRLPGESWGDHATTTWRTPRLPGGWQTIDLVYRQGLDASELHLTWGNGKPVTIDELRATRAPDELAASDSTNSMARATVFTHALERLGLTAPLTPWTTEALAQCVEQGQIVATAAATEQAKTPVPPTPGGNGALAITLAEIAIQRHDVTTALAWMARAAQLAGENETPEAKRFSQEMARLTKLGATADTQAELQQLNQELARLRERIPRTSDAVAPLIQAGPSPLMHARQAHDTARGNLALAAAALALELRESAPTARVVAEQAEALDRAAREPHPPADESLLAAATSLITHLTITTDDSTSPAAAIANGGIADPSRETAARRFSAALERLTEATERLTRIVQRPHETPSQQDPPTVPLPITQAGRQRSRLTLPTIDESGIDGYRPDQQQAIRAYLDRLRRQQHEAP